MNNAASITIRLTGGVGGHLLGMRVIDLAYARTPDRPIVIHSAPGNDADARRIAALSPFVSEVIAVDGEVDAWIDAAGDDLFAQAAIALRMPLFEFLAARPVLQIPAWAAAEADQVLRGLSKASAFVGVCFAGEDADTLQPFESRMLHATQLALELVSSDAIALNFFRTPAPPLANLAAMDPRIVSCPDLPIEVVAALLARCRYFVGGDNGIKHLAWALDIPRTFFVRERPPRLDILRWMPDVHRLLTFDCGEDRLRRHLEGAAR